MKTAVPFSSSLFIFLSSLIAVFKNAQRAGISRCFFIFQLPVEKFSTSPLFPFVPFRDTIEKNSTGGGRMAVQLGAKIRELRKKRRISQEVLAQYLGVTFQAVSAARH